MLKAEQIVARAERVDERLSLPFEKRQKSRLRATLDGGGEILLNLPRGHVLRHGTLLRTTEGSIVEVLSAPETLSTVVSADPHLLCRAAYHLGNRHVPLQIEPGRLAYQHDHVLDDMLRRLGLSVEQLEAPFEPESGAYSGSHSHAH